MAALDDLRTNLDLMVRMRNNMAPTDWQRNLIYKGNEDLVLRHGTVYTRAKRKPPPVCPIPKACFHQSYRLATRKGSKWIYVEGFATSPDALGLPVLHAWLTLPAHPGEAFDVAWTHRDAVYIGIPFQAAFVKSSLRANGEYSVLDAWPQHYPLLTGKIALADVIWKGGDATIG